jgi:hypothetical protein
MNSPETSWLEERLFVLRTLEDLKAEQRRQSEAVAGERASVIEKGSRDIRAAHEKIRALEKSGNTLRLKNWIMTLALGGAGAVVIEFLKAFIHGWKP